VVNEAHFCWVWRLEVFEETCLYFMFMEESTYIVVGALGGGGNWDIKDDEGGIVSIVFVISS